MSTELTKTETQLPAEMAAQFAAEAGAGFEDMGADDYALPFIVLLQALSPQLDPTQGSYVPEAKPGMFLNTVTGELMESFDAIPCAYAFRVVERKPRNQGGGFVARYSREEAPTDGVPQEKGAPVRPNGNELVNTAYHYLLLPDGAVAVLALRSTQLRKSKQWNGKMAGLKMKSGDKTFTPPMYSSLYHFAAGAESTEKGRFFGWVITRVGYVQDPETAKAAKAFSEIALGRKLAEDSAAQAEATPADDKEIPF